jgi:predicted regulator of Ras-like GTPase activity (Roadblock/LC7/MglB family)
VQCACIVRGGEVLASSFADGDKVAQAASLGFVRGISDGLELVDRRFEEMVVDFAGRSLMVAPVDKDFVLAMLAAPDANTQLLRVVMGSSVRQLRRMHDIAEKPEPAPAQQPAAAKPAAGPAPAGQAAAAPAAARPGVPVPPPPPGKPQPAAPPPPPQAAAKPQPTGRPPQAPPPGAPPQAAKPAPPPPPPLKGQQPPGRPGAPAPAASAAPPPPKPGAKPEPAPAAAKVSDKDAEPILPQVLALLTEYIGPVARVSFKRGVTRWRETSTPTVGTLGELAKILAADLSSDSEKKAFLDAVERLRGS